MKIKTISIAILSFILLTLLSCKGTKDTTTEYSTLIFDEIEETNTIPNIETTIDDSLSETIDTSIAIIEEVEEIVSEKKDRYNIALIMPFQEDSIKGNWEKLEKEDYNEYRLPSESEISLSFLEGMILSLENIHTDAHFDIHLYDNKASTEGTKSALNKIESQDIDIIIGPYSKKNTLLTANFAKENEIIHISPFSPSKSIGIDNPYYFMVAPSIEKHIQAMIDFSIDSLDKANIKLIYENTSKGKKYADYVSIYIDTYNASTPNIANKINYALIPVAHDANDRKSFNIGKHLDYEQKNAVIITSFDEGFVHSMLTQLNSKIETYDIHTFGMPTWLKSESLRLEYFNSLQVYFTDNKWENIDREYKHEFDDLFNNRYNSSPNVYAGVGYDLMNLFGKTIDQYGINIAPYIIEKPHQGVVANYNFSIDMDDNGTLNRIENKEVFIFQFSDYELHLK